MKLHAFYDLRQMYINISLTSFALANITINDSKEVKGRKQISMVVCHYFVQCTETLFDVNKRKSRLRK